MVAARFQLLRSMLISALAGPAVLTLAPAVQAGPALYANSFALKTPQETCLRDVRKALLALGVRENGLEAMTITNSSGKDVQFGWSADHPSENVTLFFECDAPNRMGALAVAGEDNDITYEVYKQIFGLWMK